MRGTDYEVKSGDKYIDVSFNMFTDNEVLYTEAYASAYEVMKSLSLSTTPYVSLDDEEVITEPSTPSQVDPTPTPEPSKPSATGPLSTRLRGHILLQVEEKGEAWYVRPDNGHRLYMPDGAAAYNMMRSLGMGITNADLAKIPVGIEDRFEELDSDGDGLGDKLEEGLQTDPYKKDSDGDGYDDGTEVLNGYNPLGEGTLSYNNLGQTLKGKILLQVESRGEAWYINPDDGKRYYMKNGDSAYQIMRFLSLGITNNDLGQIPETNL